MLYDYKGRRSTPRPHLVPIIDPAQRALDAIPRDGCHLLKLKVGRPVPHPATLFRHLQCVARGAVHESHAGGGLNFAILRRTVETQTNTRI
jgi:hypothetical protein